MPDPRTRRRWARILVIAGLVLAADQATKAWARRSLRPAGWPARCASAADCRAGQVCAYGNCRVTLVPRYLAFEYHENRGSAFGLLSGVPGARYILVVVGVAVLFLVWRMVRQVPRRQGAADVAFALVAGGAVGNLVDRIHLGRVVDFVLMHWQDRYRWPAYNVADAALVAGVILLLIVLGRQPAEAADEAGGGGRRRRRAR